MNTHFLKNYFTARKKHDGHTKISSSPSVNRITNKFEQIVMCENHENHINRDSPNEDDIILANYDVKRCQLLSEMLPRCHDYPNNACLISETPACHETDIVEEEHGTKLTQRQPSHESDATNEEIRWRDGTKPHYLLLILSVLCLNLNNTSLLRFLYVFINSFVNFTRALVHSKNCDKVTNHDRWPKCSKITFSFLVFICVTSLTAANEFDKTELFRGNKISEQSIAAVFNKVAYGSTTKRSIPDNAYLYTTLATPLLTTYRYSDGNQEWYRVDVKEPDKDDDDMDTQTDPRRNFDDDFTKQRKDEDYDNFRRNENREYDSNYGSELEKDHALPTSAPAADILKNNNNKNYNNPNRYNNDRLRPNFAEPRRPHDILTDRNMRTSTTSSILKNVRPTKSMFGKEVPSYVPPSRSFFTPPLPPEYLNPFADKPTLRGTNSESYQNRRPIPPPSLMPKKDRIPFRPDLPGRESPVETDRLNERPNMEIKPSENKNSERKKTLNTPSQNVNLDRLGEFYGLNRLHNESNFEYEPMVLIPSISRILSGSNGRKEDIPDILLRTVTATPNIQRNPNVESKPKNRDSFIPSEPKNENPKETEVPVRKSVPESTHNSGKTNDNTSINKNPVPFPEAKVPDPEKEPMIRQDTTTATSELLNLPNVKEKNNRVEVANATKTDSREIWQICWNVHVYLVVFLYISLAIFSIVKLIRFEKETHMFSKSYFLSIHLLLTTICVLRIFYLVYDPYNIADSFSSFMYDFLHNFPLSLLATTFAILIVFLLKRTLNHLKVKTRPIFLVVFGLGHIFLCFCLNLSESLELFGKNTFLSLVCRFVFILLCWSLGLSYVYLYKIIKNVLAKKSQNLSEICTQNISYASHITIAVALLFTLLGCVELYGLFFIKIDRFTIPFHWILWGFELSIRFLEISIITLLAIVVSLRMSQREKQNVGFPLFPCTTSDSSTDNIYPNNCSTNLNALNYSLRSQNQYRQDMALENLPTDIVERPNLLKNSFQNDSFDKKSTLDRFQSGRNSANCLESDRSTKYDRSSLEAERSENASDYEKGVYDRGSNFERFERPNWGSQRFDNEERFERDNFPVRNFERAGLSDSEQGQPSSGHFDRGSGRRNFDRASPADFPKPHFDHGSGRSKTYEKSKYYVKPKFDADLYNNEEYQREFETRPKLKRPDMSNMSMERPHLEDEHNVYSEPLDVNHEYERTRHDFERSDFDRRSKSSWNNSGRRSIGRSGKKGNVRPNLGVQTLPNQDMSNSMLVDENGFVRFRHLGEHEKPPKKHKHSNPDNNHYSDA